MTITNLRRHVRAYAPTVLLTLLAIGLFAWSFAHTAEIGATTQLLAFAGTTAIVLSIGSQASTAFRPEHQPSRHLLYSPHLAFHLLAVAIGAVVIVGLSSLVSMGLSGFVDTGGPALFVLLMFGLIYTFRQTIPRMQHYEHHFGVPRGFGFITRRQRHLVDGKQMMGFAQLAFTGPQLAGFGNPSSSRAISDAPAGNTPFSR